MMESVMTFDSFGESVASVLEDLSTLGDVRSSPSAAQVVVSGRPRRQEFLRLDDERRRAGEAWLPVTLEYPFVHVGPLLKSDAGPCYECFCDRGYQHDDASATTRAVHDLYAPDSPTPPLHLPQHVRIVAALILEALRQPSSRVLTFDIAHNSVRADVVVPWHGCPRCSDPEFAVRRDAELASLVTALSPSTPGAGS